MRQSGSKRRAATGFVVRAGALPGGVKPPRSDVGLDLKIPFVGNIFLEPAGKVIQLFLGQAGHRIFNFLDTHGFYRFGCAEPPKRRAPEHQPVSWTETTMPLRQSRDSWRAESALTWNGLESERPHTNQTVSGYDAFLFVLYASCSKIGDMNNVIWVCTLFPLAQILPHRMSLRRPDATRCCGRGNKVHTQVMLLSWMRTIKSRVKYAASCVSKETYRNYSVPGVTAGNVSRDGTLRSGSGFNSLRNPDSPG